MESIETKVEVLKKQLLERSPLLVAYSGGVDSTLLLTVAGNLPGCAVHAVTVKTEFASAEELAFAEQNVPAGIGYTVLEESILSSPDITTNPPERCYFCKKTIFSALLFFAKQHGYSCVVEGSHSDDDADFRPGKRALQELNVISPLRDAGLTKAEIRSYARELGIAIWDKPANPCLATRIPYGTHITKEKLVRIDKAENFLRNRGYKQVRVRDHENIARIEIPEEQISVFLKDDRVVIARQLKTYGYTYVTVDLDGYRMGSMNAMIVTKNVL